ncbi:hypothetical protein BHM03_00010569 [Ensete ventricosum]|nr:hypothetical protein BHM03_00010569 [Ensete ventricosum]
MTTILGWTTQKGAGDKKHSSSVSMPMEEEEQLNRQQEGPTQLQEKLVEFQVWKSTRPTTIVVGEGGVDAGNLAEEAVPKREKRPVGE